jgi:glycosyltransferase involved in cell wall biosynthesis
VTETDPRRFVLVVPLAPSRTGNGLAMRAGVLLEALSVAGPVDLVVVPVSGPALPLDWARALARTMTVVDPPTGMVARDALTEQLGDARLRERLISAAPLPARAAAAPPTLAARIEDRLPPGGPPAAVVALRTYLAPLGVELAVRTGADRVVVDADDDDEALLRALGDPDSADAERRLAAAWLPDADEVWAAGPVDAAALAARHDLRSVRVVPNAVRVPAAVVPSPGDDRLLFVGNLTYSPNIDAARDLALDVLPRVQQARPGATLDLVGPHGAGGFDDLATVSGVRCCGFVDDVASAYTRASVVVVPLRHGAGTRVKIIEACAHARPVVASSPAIAGLEVLVDAGVRQADGADATAAAVLTVLADPGLARQQARSTRAAVIDHYTPAVVGPVIRRAALGEPDAVALRARVLAHDVTVTVPDESVYAAFETMLPAAVHDFAADWPMHYSVEGGTDRYRVVEEGDAVGVVATAADVRDLVHLRLYRRAFEWASRRGWLRLHGALVDFGGVRVLFSGPSGVGKSTLALRLLLDGASVQCDESVLVRRGASVAVARPLHLKVGTDQVVPEFSSLRARLPHIDDVVVLDPGRLGYPWSITVATLDHVVLLSADADPTCIAIGQTEALPELVTQVFAVTESAPALLGALTAALAGVRCHRLGVAHPEAMHRALRHDLL